MLNYIKKVVANTPSDWLELTTYRLDIYHEELAKTGFLEEFEKLYSAGIADTEALENLPTAYDYIRLGHPLSSVLEWAIARLNGLDPDQIISFSSVTMPVLAILRKNKLDGRKTRILYTDTLHPAFEGDTLREIYGYKYVVEKVESLNAIPAFQGSTIFLSPEDKAGKINLQPDIDFYVHLHGALGSVLIIQSEANAEYIPTIQHVRRRETIAMTPANCYTALKLLIGESDSAEEEHDLVINEARVRGVIREITATTTKPLLGSSGLSVQYAIMMGLIENAKKNHPGKTIKIVVPPNCYGGTNDQARRVAAAIEQVEIVDLPVDRENDMGESTDRVLDEAAAEDAIPYIIAEIPTNPRIEVPDLKLLQEVLLKKRKTPSGKEAIAPVFILDQTFCPNVQFLGEKGIFTFVKTIAYVSGSKFPSGGKCTAGYCVANEKGSYLMEFIEKHLTICDNQATPLQIKILAEQMPSMNRRIAEAYENTREFVNFIRETLPEAKINFVSEKLAREGFTPSVFSLDLPSHGKNAEEREANKRALNKRLIDMMITEIPGDSKYCVSYGQLKGCYWTIPATSTQGTTKEADKDYIARVSVAPTFDLEKHKEVFLKFVKSIKEKPDGNPRFKLREGDEYITLDKLLKLMRLVNSGGEAHAMIDQGLVKVNGLAETQKRKKMRPGDFAEFNGEIIRVEAG